MPDLSGYGHEDAVASGVEQLQRRQSTTELRANLKAAADELVEARLAMVEAKRGDTAEYRHAWLALAAIRDAQRNADTLHYRIGAAS